MAREDRRTGREKWRAFFRGMGLLMTVFGPPRSPRSAKGRLDPVAELNRKLGALQRHPKGREILRQIEEGNAHTSSGPRSPGVPRSPAHRPGPPKAPGQAPTNG